MHVICWASTPGKTLVSSPPPRACGFQRRPSSRRASWGSGLSSPWRCWATSAACWLPGSAARGSGCPWRLQIAPQLWVSGRMATARDGEGGSVKSRRCVGGWAQDAATLVTVAKARQQGHCVRATVGAPRGRQYRELPAGLLFTSQVWVL